uniref:C-type lectin domain-containing protein n=1 Tax=Seriola dumerili TaxID=41447 RepID=A0A3B4UT17_SERDU
CDKPHEVADTLFVSRWISCQYHFVSESKTFREAQRHYREKHTDLATIDNMEDNQKISWYLKENKVGEPNNRGNTEVCVAAKIGLSGRWEERSCDQSRGFICYSRGEWQPMMNEMSENRI